MTIDLKNKLSMCYIANLSSFQCKYALVLLHLYMQMSNSKGTNKKNTQKKNKM